MQTRGINEYSLNLSGLFSYRAMQFLAWKRREVVR
jgi:hypothetical protein